jgi:PAS domain S-box-containing protein
MQSPRPAEGVLNDTRPFPSGTAWIENRPSCGDSIFPFRYAVIIGALILISYAAIIIGLGDNLEAKTIFADIASFAIDALVTLALFYGAYKSRCCGNRIYLAWMMLAISRLFFTIGDFIWAYIELILHESPFPAPSDYFYLISYPFFLLGILLLPSVKFNSTERLKITLDTAIVLIAAILVFWSFIIAPTISQSQGTDIITMTLSVAYPVMDLVLLFALAELLLKRIHLPGLNPLLFLAGGITVLIISDAIILRQIIEGTYADVGFVDLGWPLGYILIGLAGMAQADSIHRGTFRENYTIQPHYGQIAWPLYLPYLCAAGAFALLIWSKEESMGLSFSSLSWAVAGIIGMVIARQILALNENSQLYSKAQQEILERRQAEHEIKRLNEELEHRVRERTSELETANKELQTEIVERKQIEYALKDSERRLADIINFLPDATFVVNREGRVIAWNKAIESLTGVKAENILGKGNYEYSLPFYGERRPILIDIVQKADTIIEQKYNNIKRQQDGTLIGEAYMPRLKGGEIYLVGSAASLFDSEGNISGAIESMRDITERKHVEEDLQSAKEKAESATKAKSQFLANMSHEIRTPMNAVIGLTGLLMETEMTPVQKDYVETIRNSGDALLAIINDILDFSKIDGGRMVLESQPFDIRSSIEESLDLVAARAAEKELELVYFIEDGVPEMVVGDVTRLRQILVNLVGNAVKFTEKGEVIVFVNASPLEEGRVEILFAVKDTGIGISEENMGSLFQSFSQVDSSTTRNYGGTGLGLAISKRLVELMGGVIEVKSQPGKGSTFSFTVKAEVFGSKWHSHAEDRILAGRRIIIVDDNEIARLMLMKSACSWGMDVTEATSGQDALNLLKAGQIFDIALIDAVMPEMDGITLARELKDRWKRDILIILISPFGLSKLLDPSLAGGLTKPVKPLQLRKLLVDLISPSVNETMGKVAAFRPAVEEGSHSLRILLAEDNAVNQKVAISMLRRLGYKADVAANGIEVLRAVERQHYDVVLMDVQMPEMDGFEATCCIRKRESAAKQPWIIAMTAYALEGDKEECFRAGMNEYISKPIKMVELQEALDRRSEAIKAKAS